MGPSAATRRLVGGDTCDITLSTFYQAFAAFPGITTRWKKRQVEGSFLATNRFTAAAGGVRARHAAGGTPNFMIGAPYLKSPFLHQALVSGIFELEAKNCGVLPDFCLNFQKWQSTL
jgi:hypothetical protein